MPPAAAPPPTTSDRLPEGASNPQIDAARSLFPQLQIIDIRPHPPHAITYGTAQPGVEGRFLLHLLRPSAAATSDRCAKKSSQILSLRHAGLAPLAHSGVVANHPCFFGPDPGGMPFEEFADRGDTRPADVLAAVAQVASALAVAHQAGICHLGLTGTDVMVGDDGAAVLHRVGFVELLSADLDSAVEIARGYPPELGPYLAPELGDPLSSPDARADAYSLGVLLYRGLTGRLPGGFFVRPSLSSHLDKRIDDLVETCLQQVPDNRTLSAEELARELLDLARHGGEGFAERRQPEIGGGHDPASQTQADARDARGGASASGARRGKRTAMVAAALVAVGAGGYFAYQHFESTAPESAEAPVASDGKRFPEAVASLRASQATGEPLTIDQLAEIPVVAREVLTSAHPGDQVAFAKSLDVLTQVGAYDQAATLSENYLDVLPTDHPNRAELVATRKAFLANLTRYREAMGEAERALEAGNDAGEFASLGTALEAFPHDPKVAYLLGHNPLAIESRIQGALDGLRESNGSDSIENHSFNVFRGGSHLNLSGNAKLRDISALRPIPIHGLDLSGTSVDDLSPLEGKQLERLWIDDTPVASLAPLSGMPLETLAFENTKVKDGSLLETFPALTTVRHTLGGAAKRIIPPPRAGEDWENGLGMRFAPLPGTGSLMGIWETRERDFRQFARSVGLDPGSPAAPESTAESGPSQDRFPVANVSALQASRFCEWLTGRDRADGFLTPEMRYRLPTDFEWSLAAGADPDPLLSPAALADSSVPKFPWGTAWPPPPTHEQSPLQRVDYAPATNGFQGLSGNVREWTGSLPDPQFAGIHIVRGASSTLLAAPEAAADYRTFDLNRREAIPQDDSADDLGFRIVLDLAPPDGEDPAAMLADHVTAGDWAAALETAHAIIDEGAQGATPAAGSAAASAVDSAARTVITLDQMRTFFIENRRLTGSLRNQQDQFGGRRYVLCQLPLDWDTAERLASEVGGHLIAIQGEEQRAWLQQTYGGETNRPLTVWTGAAPSQDGSWHWVRGGNPESLPAAPPSSSDARLLYGHEFVELTPSTDGQDPGAGEAASGSGGSDPNIPPLPRPPSPVVEKRETGWKVQPAWREAPALRRHPFIIEWG
ncbi:hypothetical protein BH23VER1_BH23VER1_16720 [soil metagenome]